MWYSVSVSLLIDSRTLRVGGGSPAVVKKQQKTRNVLHHPAPSGWHRWSPRRVRRNDGRGGLPCLPGAGDRGCQGALAGQVGKQDCFPRPCQAGVRQPGLARYRVIDNETQRGVLYGGPLFLCTGEIRAGSARASFGQACWPVFPPCGNPVLLGITLSPLLEKV